MKSYRIKVSFFNGSVYKFQRTAKKIRKMNNVNNLVFNMFKIEDIKKIEVYCWNENTKKHYIELTYQYQFEQWKKNHARIEAINAPGYEDLTGYGNRTDGKINRFYIGRSTGWIPIYLEILTNNSTGGVSLFTIKRKFQVI